MINVNYGINVHKQQHNLDVHLDILVVIGQIHYKNVYNYHVQKLQINMHVMVYQKDQIVIYFKHVNGMHHQINVKILYLKV